MRSALAIASRAPAGSATGGRVIGRLGSEATLTSAAPPVATTVFWAGTRSVVATSVPAESGEGRSAAAPVSELRASVQVVPVALAVAGSTVWPRTVIRPALAEHPKPAPCAGEAHAAASATAAHRSGATRICGVSPEMGTPFSGFRRNGCPPRGGQACAS